VVKLNGGQAGGWKRCYLLNTLHQPDIKQTTAQLWYLPTTDAGKLIASMKFIEIVASACVS